MSQLVLYKGEHYIKEETDTEVKLTQVVQHKGEDTVVILRFTKDRELSDKAKYNAGKKIYKSIIKNLHK